MPIAPQISNKSSMIGIVVILLACLQFAYLAYWTYDFNAVFDTDEADHANAALEVYASIKNFSLSDFINSILRQSFYPPLHSFVTTASYFLLSPSLFSSRIPSVLLIFLSVLILARLVYIHREQNISHVVLATATIWSAFLLISTPKINYVSVLCMLEPLGIFLFTCLVYAIYLFEKQASSKNLWLISILVICLSLTKYTLAAVCIPAVALMMLLAVVQKRISLSSFIKHAALIFLVMIAWLLLIDYNSVYHFIFNQPPVKGGIISEKNLLFYPRVFFRGFVINNMIGVIILITALYGLIINRKKFTVQFAALSILIALIIFTLSSENGARHILFVLPGLFFLSGMGVLKLKYHKLVPIFLLILGSVTIYQCLQIAPHKFLVHFESPRSSGELYQKIAEQVEPGSRVLVNGTTDSISLEGLRFAIASAHEKKYTEIVVDAYPFTKRTKKLAYAHKRNLAQFWTIDNVPKKPITEVLKSGHYDYYLVLRSNDPATNNPELKKELQSLYKNKKVIELQNSKKLSAGLVKL